MYKNIVFFRVSDFYEYDKKKWNLRFVLFFKYIFGIFSVQYRKKKKKIRNLINKLQFFEFTLINFNLESSRIPRILFNALYIIRLFTDFVSLKKKKKKNLVHIIKISLIIFRNWNERNRSIVRSKIGSN